MAGDPQQNDDLEHVWADLERELGPKRPSDEEQDALPALPQQAPRWSRQRLVAEPPAPPQPQRVALPLHRPWATYVLLALIIIIWVLPELLDRLGLSSALVAPLEGLLRAGIPSNPNSYDPGWSGLSGLVPLLGEKNNSAIFSDGQWYRLLTAIFLHGGIAHLGFNSYALYALGPESERLFGTGRFLAIYFIAGLAGSLASYAFNIRPSLGASGAIFGLIGALAAFYYVQRELFGAVARAQLNSIAGIAAINLLIGFVLPGIDNWGHIGGLVLGGLAGLLLAPRFVVDRRFAQPQILRRDSSLLSWGGVLALLALEVLLTFTIVPPLPPP